MQDEINLTFETLFEILMREKNKEELQKLEPQFLQHVRDYIKEKQRSLSEQDSQFGMSSKGEKQIENAIRIFKELIERRERKVLTLAHLKVRAQSNIIDMSAMLPEEKQLYEDLVILLERTRNRMFNLPVRESLAVPRPEPVTVVEKTVEPITPVKPMLLLRFLNPVPKFLGRDMEVYGPYESEEVANLPQELAEILIRKGRAEEIKSA
jgi:DNA replication initiation complex subunit (GINS family)